MRFILLLTIVICAALSNAQEWAKKRLEASPRHQEWVELKNGSRTVKAFVVYPERKDKAPVVIVIHEIFGLTDWAQSVADQLAEHGFIAIAPDLLSGMAPGGGRSVDFPAGKANEAVSSLPPDQVTGDLNAACDYAKTIPSGNGKLAVMGFCWGGSQTFRFATNRSDLSAAMPFYGTAPTDTAALGKISSPVYGFYGGNDSRVTSTVEPTTKAMKEAGKSYEPTVYDGAGHGFMRAGEQPEPSEDNKKAHDAAWKRVLEILGKL